MSEERSDHIRTRIWLEEPEADNRFATRIAYCHGYDVYGELLGQAGWIDMLYLLFRGQAPSLDQARLLEVLAVALANPGPRDPSVHAAMCGGVAGSTAAASLMAALSVGAGRLGGAREVFDAMNIWIGFGDNHQSCVARFADKSTNSVDIWPAAEHPPGFDPHGVATATIVRQLLDRLAGIGATPHLTWLAAHRSALEGAVGLPLAISGVAAAALVDLGFDAAEGEMLYLLLRLPGAAAHALEQEKYGFKRFPFYRVELENDPTKQVTQ